MSRTLASNNIVKITPAGTQSTFASIDHPTSLAFDRLGNLYVWTALNIIFKFTPTGTKNNFATVNTDVEDLAFEPPTGILANISTRADVKTGAQVLIAGFVVTGYVNTGRAPFLSGDLAGAIATNRKAFELRKALVAADSTNGDYRHLLSLAYQNDGDYQAWNKNTNAALDSFQKKLTIDEQSVAADPANAQARDDLA